MNDKKNGAKKPGSEKDQKEQGKGATAGAGKPAAAKTDKVLKLSDLAGLYLKRKSLFDRQYSALKTRLDSTKKNLDRLGGLATQLESKIVALIPPSVKHFVDPLAKELAAMFPGFGYQVTEPTGVAEAVTLIFFPKDTTEEQRLSGTGCKSLTIVTKTKDGSIGIRDFTRDTKTYPVGSLAYASGLNHPTIPVAPDASVKWFSQYVK
jgi:hypothetical protein